LKQFSYKIAIQKACTLCLKRSYILFLSSALCFFTLTPHDRIARWSHKQMCCTGTICSDIAIIEWTRSYWYI